MHMKNTMWNGEKFYRKLEDWFFSFYMRNMTLISHVEWFIINIKIVFLDYLYENITLNINAMQLFILNAFLNIWGAVINQLLIPIWYLYPLWKNIYLGPLPMSILCYLIFLFSIHIKQCQTPSSISRYLQWLLLQLQVLSHHSGSHSEPPRNLSNWAAFQGVH